jgi:CRP-like cAMP-binding protein
MSHSNESRNARIGDLLHRIASALEAMSLSDVLPMSAGPAGAIARRSGGGSGSQYLKAQDAADYLGITVKSLYGIVERRHLRPLRGPKRSYRFTQRMLDDYLKVKQ